MSSRDDALLIPGQPPTWVATGTGVGFKWACSFSPGGQRIFFVRNASVPPFYSEGVHQDSWQDFDAWFFGPATFFAFATLGNVPVQVTWH